MGVARYIMRLYLSAILVTLSSAYLMFDGRCQISGGSMTYQNGIPQSGVGGLNSVVNDLSKDCTQCKGGSSFSESTSKAWSENGACTVESAEINCKSDASCIVSAETKTCSDGICSNPTTAEPTTTDAPFINWWCANFGWWC